MDPRTAPLSFSTLHDAPVGARAASNAPRLPRPVITALATLVLTLALLPSAGLAASGDKPAEVPPRPPAMDIDALANGPSLAFQIESSNKDSVALSLSAGWNLVSLPLEPYDTAITSILAPIAGSVGQVWVYEGCDALDPWRLYDPTDPAASNLTNLDHRLGFWILLTADALLTLDGDPPVDSTTPICTGWNLIGHPRNAPLPVAGALVSIAASVDRVFAFEGGSGTYGWSFWSPDTPSWVHDLEQLSPGRGYWVLANADATFVAVEPEPPPTLGALNLLEGQVVTAPMELSATIDTNAEVTWTLAHRPEGETTWSVFGQGSGPVVTAQLDPTLLLNGIYEVRLEATDVFGQSTTAEGNVQVDGAMKPGVVTLSFADLTVPMAGLPITVVRTYDSRDKSVGDFGVGWRLELVKGTYRNNRPPGEGWILTGSTSTFPQIPCDRSVETLGHFTDIRLGDQSAYRFALVVDTFGTESLANGGCDGEARFVQTGGRPGASLDILGNRDVFHPGQTHHLLDASTQEIFEPQTVLLTTPEGLEYVLTLDGGVQQVSDPAGQTVTFDDNGIHHSDGRSVFFERDGLGRIRYLIDPAGQTVSYSYDAAGDLVAVTDRAAETIRLEYLPEIPHHLARLIAPDGSVCQEFGYDDTGRAVLSCNASGHCLEMDHDLAGRRETVYDASGRPALLDYDEAGQVLARTDALGHTTHFTYDPQGRMTSTTDAMGAVTSMTYDERGNLLSITKPHAPGDDAADFTTQQLYDLQNRLLAVDFPGGGGLRFTYGASDQATQISDHDGNVLAAFSLDTAGRTVSESGPFGSEQMVLDSAGNVVQSTDAFGRVRHSSYDALNRLTSLTSGDDQVATFAYDAEDREIRADYGNGIAVDFDYDSGSLWTRAEGPTLGSVERLLDEGGRTAGWRRGDGSEVRFEKGPAGRLLREVEPLGRTTTFTYDAAGHLTSTTDPRGGTTTLIRDPVGRVIERQDALGHASLRSYRPDGQLESVTNPLGHTWTFETTPLESTTVDPLGRTTRVALSDLGLPTTWSFADGSSRAAEYLLSSPWVDAQDYPTRLTDEVGRQRLFTYDSFGRMTSASDEAGAATTYAWAEELLTSITGPTGESRSFTYDALDNVASISLEDGGAIHRTYGDDNRLASETRPSGVAWSYEYDAVGHLESRHASSGESVSFSWNTGDELVAMDDSTGTTGYQYDAGGDLSDITFPDGSSVRYERDLLGRVTAVTVEAPASAPMTTTYGYDDAGRLVSVADPLGGSTSWVYNAVGRPLSRSLPNGVVSQWTYDLRDRLSSVSHRRADGVVLASAAYERSASGEPSRITFEDGSRVDLTYDAGLRLASERFFDAAGLLEEEITYTYDAAGNRLSRGDAAGLSTYTYAPGQRLVGVDGPSPESYGYDADGRRTSMLRDGESWSLSFDAADRLSAVAEGGMPVASYVHDGSARRVGATSQGIERRLLVAPTLGEGLDSPHLIRDAAGSLAAAFVWAGEEPLMRFGPSGPVYYLTDGSGSVLVLADAAGGSAARFRYDGFGNLRSSEGPQAQTAASLGGDLRFHGAWLEEATGLYHMRARDYDPATGLFLSQDPAEVDLTRPESLHPYSFADGNPYLYRDPTGLFTLIEINISINVHTSMSAMNTLIVNYLRVWARERVGEIITDLLLDFLVKMLPFGGWIDTLDGLGNKQSQVLDKWGPKVLCSALDASGYLDYAWLEVSLGADGKPGDDGLTCQQPIVKNTNVNPDFLLSKHAPSELDKSSKKSWLVGDFKFRASRNIKANGGQFKRMMAHAKNYEHMPVALYITWFPTGMQKVKALHENSLRRGVLLYLLSIKS